jgi:hypothetical protein
VTQGSIAKQHSKTSGILSGTWVDQRGLMQIQAAEKSLQANFRGESFGQKQIHDAEKFLGEIPEE